MTSKSIVVAGGAGFVGSHVVDALLNEHHRVCVLDDFSTGKRSNLGQLPRPGLSIISADIADPNTRSIIRQLRPDVLVLLAAQPSVAVSMKDPVLDARSNILGLVNMLEAAKEAGCSKFLFTTSGGTIFGDVPPEQLPITELTPLKAKSFYGLSKLTALGYLEIYREIFSLNYAALALGNVYGPRQSGDGESGVVAIFGQRIASGRPCRIFGDGKTTRDFIYVSDVADAFLAAIDNGSGLLNIGTGQETSVLDIYTELARADPSALPPEFGEPLLGEVRRISLDSSNANSQLGWRAKIDLTTGISRTYGWIAGNLS